MKLGYHKQLSTILVRPIQLDNPPPGVAVFDDPDDIAALLDDNIRVALLPPPDLAAAAFLCDGLDAAIADSPPSHSNRKLRTKHYVKFTIDYQYLSISGPVAAPSPCRSPLQHPAIAAHPLGQRALAAVTTLTDSLANTFIGCAGAPYLDFHAVLWTDTSDSGQLHTDTPWQLAATQCEAPTIFEIDGQEYQGPDYCVTLFKGDRVRHRADLRHPVSPARPRTQLCWDVGRKRAERFLD